MEEQEELQPIEIHLDPDKEPKIAGLGNVIYITSKDKTNDSGLKYDKAMLDELLRTPPVGIIIPDDKHGYILKELSEDKISRKMGWIKD
jgi:hypothetical protein